MTLSTKAQKIYSQLGEGTPKMGDLKKIAKEIKKDHELAMELWGTGEYYPRLVAVLIMDKTKLTQDVIDGLANDLNGQTEEDRNKISEWLLANQLMKSKKTAALIGTWEHHPSPILQRLFWYHQGRMRWMGNTPPPNTPELLVSLEKNMANAKPEVQWAMNFSAGWIGVHEPEFRTRCIELGEKIGLYKGDPVPRGCTPSYLPEFIRIEAEKVGK